jgi:hypothetical protein
MYRRSCILFILLLAQSSAFGLQGYGITESEEALLPRFCHTPSLFGKIQGGGCPMLNHFCYGLAHMQRVYANTNESRYWLSVALDNYRSIIGRWGAKCPLTPELQVNMGKALLLKAKRGVASEEAVQNFSKALALNPDFLPAYYALSDYYANLGDKKKALSVIEDGLRHVPKSKGLLRRFKELGGTVPPRPLVVTSKPKADSPTRDNSLEEQETPVEDKTVEPTPKEGPPAQKTLSEQPTEPSIGTPSNPWCRFCPPE